MLAAFQFREKVSRSDSSQDHKNTKNALWMCKRQPCLPSTLWKIAHHNTPMTNSPTSTNNFELHISLWELSPPGFVVLQQAFHNHSRSILKCSTIIPQSFHDHSTSISNNSTSNSQSLPYSFRPRFRRRSLCYSSTLFFMSLLCYKTPSYWPAGRVTLVFDNWLLLVLVIWDVF